MRKDLIEIEEIRREIEKIRNVLTWEWPFLAAIFRKLRIVADDRIPTAGVNRKNVLLINPQFYKTLSLKGKAIVYTEEGLHAAFFHPQRGENKEHKIYNLAADCVVHGLQMAVGMNLKELPFDIVTPEWLAQIIRLEKEKIAKMSAEEIYWHLLKQVEVIKFNVMEDLLAGDGEGDEEGEEEERVIQEGDPEAYREGKTQEELEKYWKRALIDAWVIAKRAGKLPGKAERIIEELIKPKQNWKEIVRKEIVSGLGRLVISSWQISSRKHPGYPGIKHLGLPTIWSLIDTSGSIDKNEICQLMGIIYDIARNRAKLIIIPWDAKAYPQIVVRRPTDVYNLQKTGISGGGGTQIISALIEAFQSMRLGDIVLILTDGFIGDWDTEQAQELFRKISQKSSLALSATLNQQITLPLKWRKIKIES